MGIGEWTRAETYVWFNLIFDSLCGAVQAASQSDQEERWEVDALPPWLQTDVLEGAEEEEDQER